MKLEVMVLKADGCYECVPVGGPHPDTGEPVCIPMEIKGAVGGGPITLTKDDIAEAIQGVDVDGDGDVAVVGG